MLKALLLSCVFISFTASSLPVFGQLLPLKVSAVRKKLDETKSHSNDITSKTKEIVYSITVQNSSFKAMPDLSVEYMFFYEDTQPGQKGNGTIKSLKGSEKTSLDPNRSFTFDSKSLKLTTQELDGDWTYTSGASGRNKDRVKGIWIQVFAQGLLVGEYVNPTTVSKKYEWKN